MSYSCRIYKNSGFNSCNIPDTPALLEQCAFIDVPTLQIMQERFLSSIRVKSTWSDIKNGDYVKLYNTETGSKWFYSIENISMQAKDVAVLSVIPDYINSVGGVSGLKIVDGITERVHVSSDSFGEYTMEDPLTTPAEPLQVQKVWVQIAKDTNTIVESTVDIPWQMSQADGVTFVDKNTETGEESTVVVPTLASFPDPNLESFPTKFTLSGSDTTIHQGTKCFDLSDSEKAPGATYNGAQTIKAGISRLRSLGVENAVIAQVSMPTEYVSVTNASGALIGEKYTWSFVKQLQGVWSENVIDIPYSYTGAKNNRVNYGEFTKYGIISTSSESCEFDAEDIVESGSAVPHITKVGDPRLTGKPYFRFKTVNGDSSQLGFFRNCISGLPWKNVPLVYREASGNALNTLRYENSKAVSTQAYQYGTQQNVFSQAQNLVSGSAGIAGSALSADVPGAFTGIANMAANTLSLQIQQENREAKTRIARRNELAELEIANTVYIPTVNFPMNAEFLRDFYGNGCLVYRYRYSPNDISRIDRLLTMYGYRHAKPLTVSDFSNRKYFNFVKCPNVTVTGHPRWINDGIHEQLANGVRVWHVLPSSSYYSNNPIKE